MPIDPTMAVRGGEWSVSLGEPTAGAKPTGGGSGGGSGFGGMLAQQIGALEKLQTDAAGGAQALAAGHADPTQVVMAVEKARLSMQLAGQIRTKAVEAIQDVFHTQV
jgi:flagellar hook-basal body complex protein FliE